MLRVDRMDFRQPAKVSCGVLPLCPGHTRVTVGRCQPSSSSAPWKMRSTISYSSTSSATLREDWGQFPPLDTPQLQPRYETRLDSVAQPVCNSGSQSRSGGCVQCGCRVGLRWCRHRAQQRRGRRILHLQSNGKRPVEQQSGRVLSSSSVPASLSW